MSDVRGSDRAQEVARRLSQTVAHVLDESLSSRPVDDAREQARMLSLHGLDRLLSALAQYAHGLWPAPLKPVVDRMQRAAAECARAGQIDVFKRMDEELGLMARAIERVPLARITTHAAPKPPMTPVMAPRDSAAVPLADVLEGMPGARPDAELMRRVSLRPPVAGALRAALDWLVGGSGVRMRMFLASDGSALDVICEGIAYTGLQPAAEVLASVGAHLGPTGERPGAWTVRVPIQSERETFLMIEQDDLQLAVPWHAVVRVRLIPSDTIDIMLRRQALPVLPPLRTSSRRMNERPVAVVALGLKRACLVADRLVWRMSAEQAQPSGPPPADNLGRVVETDDGEQHWVLEPEWLLRGVAAPAVGMPAPRVAPLPAPPPMIERPPVSREPIPFPERAFRTAPAVATLGPEHVQPLADAEETPGPSTGLVAPADSVTPAESVATAEPVAPAVPAEASAPAADLSPVSHAPRRALVAEDSIAARIYLVRMLEQQGYEVHAVAAAADLRASLIEGPWALVCADELLPELAGLAAAGGTAVIALTRDAEDETAARAAGFALTLRKPFNREAFEQLLDRLGSEAPGATGGAPGSEPDPREWGAR